MPNNKSPFYFRSDLLARYPGAPCKPKRERFAAVTSCIEMIHRPALTIWKMKRGPEEAARLSEEATDIGSAWHGMIDDWCDGTPIRGGPLIALRLFDGFCLWAKSHEIEDVWVTGRPVWSNRYGYAGTPDRFWILDGHLVHPDFKSGRGEAYPEVALQTASYLMATYEMGLIRGPVVRFTGCGNKDTGEFTMRRIETPLQEDFRAFRAARNLFAYYRERDGAPRFSAYKGSPPTSSGAAATGQPATREPPAQPTPLPTSAAAPLLSENQNGRCDGPVGSATAREPMVTPPATAPLILPGEISAAELHAMYRDWQPTEDDEWPAEPDGNPEDL